MMMSEEERTARLAAARAGLDQVTAGLDEILDGMVEEFGALVERSGDEQRVIYEVAEAGAHRDPLSLATLLTLACRRLARQR